MKSEYKFKILSTLLIIVIVGIISYLSFSDIPLNNSIEEINKISKALNISYENNITILGIDCSGIDDIGFVFYYKDIVIASEKGVLCQLLEEKSNG